MSVYDAVGASKRHNLIAANIVCILSSSIAQTPVHIYLSGMRVKINCKLALKDMYAKVK